MSRPTPRSPCHKRAISPRSTAIRGGHLRQPADLVTALTAGRYPDLQAGDHRGPACGVAGLRRSVPPSDVERRPACSPRSTGRLFLAGSEDLPGGVIKGVTVPVHDLPHVIFPAKNRSDTQRIAM